jgi:hypothetical protein
MRRDTRLGRTAILAAAMMLLGPGYAMAADDTPKDGIEAPSEYVDDIETPGATGGVEDEVDAADAQVEAGRAEPSSTEAVGPGERAAAITTDLLIGRPTMLMATIAGSAFYALSLPITAATGTHEEALERFVEEPGNRLIGPLGE